MEDKVYHHYTGYPGHLKTISAKELMEKNPEQVIARAVYGMLPANKLRRWRWRHLKIYRAGAPR
jgi:large subunit ribosomal protein L13